MWSTMVYAHGPWLRRRGVTDGLVERRGEDIDQSLARLTGLDLPYRAPLSDLLDRILGDLDAATAEDDVAVLAARLHPAQP